MAWSTSSNWERWDPEKHIICPFDATHRIKAKRFQTHLVKCRMNHPEKDFVSCPFNASHQVLRPHLRSHITSCPDKTVIEHLPNVYGEQTYSLKGDTSVPSYHPQRHIDHSEEDWDHEIDNFTPPCNNNQDYISSDISQTCRTESRDHGQNVNMAHYQSFGRGRILVDQIEKRFPQKTCRENTKFK